MSNTSYLLSGDGLRPTLPSSTNILLEVPNHVPLLWLAALHSSDLFSEIRVGTNGKEYPACGAVVERIEAIDRLKFHSKFLHKIFMSRGDVRYHIALFGKWISELPCTHLCFDWTEYNFLNGDEHERICKAVDEMEHSNPVAHVLLQEISRISPGARFITLEQANAGDYTPDEMSTFFSLLGDSYKIAVPWR